MPSENTVLVVFLVVSVALDFFISATNEKNNFFSVMVPYVLCKKLLFIVFINLVAASNPGSGKRFYFFMSCTIFMSLH